MKISKYRIHKKMPKRAIEWPKKTIKERKKENV